MSDTESRGSGCNKVKCYGITCHDNKKCCTPCTSVIYALLLLAIVYIVYNWIDEKLEKQAFLKEQIQESGIPEEEADILYKVARAHEKMKHSEKYKMNDRYGEINNGRVEAIHLDAFYHLKRWSRLLNEIKSQDLKTQLKTIDYVIDKIDEYSSLYSTIGETKGKEIEKLVMSKNETFLAQFDNRFMDQ